MDRMLVKMIVSYLEKMDDEDLRKLYAIIQYMVRSKLGLEN